MSKNVKAVPIVGIRTSATGLKTVVRLLKALAPNPGVGFVLVPHLPSRYKSQLTHFLSRTTTLPVSPVRSGEAILPNRIYIVPSDQELVIKDGVMYLSSTDTTLLRLAALVRDSNDAIIIRDIKGRINAWNRGAEKIYGYRETEALGMNIRQIIPNQIKKIF